ncbi:hypothetical protein QO002_002171 [Pararhizobium capsulatum DSM 1112]|uniref:Uncharacterized protein n=1 Tax=Pararhizobium capsulatum DSM 1112 TaxID=1121113 RepID=A0ABU0BQ22_9HYPH|nr:hypothetical protein [Pararhizobium capsulatum]MDQ0320033.1 hypothetical protein [Pararhizobium capsulatum DSM 1112]
MDEDELLMAEINAVASRADQHRDKPMDLKLVSKTLSSMFPHRSPEEIEDKCMDVWRARGIFWRH